METQLDLVYKLIETHSQSESVTLLHVISNDYRKQGAVT